MDFYYRKQMGNGTVALKFRFSEPAGSLPPQTDSHTHTFPAGQSHHSSNCVRCYKLKKKCSRTYPKCLYCLRTGSSCEYVDRKYKKPKLDETPQPQPQKLMLLSIALLVNREENEHTFQNVDLPTDTLTLERRPNPVKRKLSLEHSLPHKLNAMDEFLVVKPIADPELPNAFVLLFFAGFSWRYPLLQQDQFLEKFSLLSFKNETFVTLDVYLVLAIGCVVYDSVKNTRHFPTIFSDKMVRSVADIVTLDADDTTQQATLLVLLAIYAIHTCNVLFIWTILGFLNRLILASVDFSNKSTKAPQNCRNLSPRAFWCVFNLEKELSMLLTKPSQFIPDSLLAPKAEFSESGPLALLMASNVDLHRLQSRLLDLKLGLAESSLENLTSFSADLENWRVNISRAVHLEYAELPVLLLVIALVNLDYYYMSIELDQLSVTELFQFTLQFLLNSFTVLLNELLGKKNDSCLLLLHFFWFQKFFNVVSFNLSLLRKILQNKSVPTSELCVKVSDFSSNLLLIINLSKYLLDLGFCPYSEKLSDHVTKLTGLSMRLMGNNLLTLSDKQKEDLIEAVQKAI